MNLPERALKDVTWWMRQMKHLQISSIIEECAMKREDTVMAFDGATNRSRDEEWCLGICAFYNGQLMMEKIQKLLELL